MNLQELMEFGSKKDFSVKIEVKNRFKYSLEIWIYNYNLQSGIHVYSLKELKKLTPEKIIKRIKISYEEELERILERHKNIQKLEEEN